MVELLLPKNSKVMKGKQYLLDKKTKKSKKLSIYRFNPDTGENPSIDTYEINLDDCGPMILDALIYIKGNIDPTLTFRRKCEDSK